MSVYIPGMEMPASCYKCNLKKIWEDGVQCLVNKGLWMDCDSKHKACPLVPVPDHGDLIDRDAVRAGIKPLSSEDERNGCTFDTVKKLMHTMLDRAPTIIPKSGGTEDE